MRRVLAACLSAWLSPGFLPIAVNAAVLPTGGALPSAIDEQAGQRVALALQAVVAGADPALMPPLAADLRNHDVEQPSGARGYGAYLRDHSGSGALTALCVLTDGDLTLVAFPAADRAGDPGARFRSSLVEVKRGRVTQLWSSGPADPGTAERPDANPADGQWHRLVANGSADRAGRDAEAALVVAFIADFFGRGDVSAATRLLAPDIRSHVPGVPSGSGFAAVALKHQDRVTAPDVQAPLFALADGELVAVGFSVPYAGDLGARYALNIVRVRDGRIVEWWYSGFPAGHPRSGWAKARGSAPGPR